MVHVKSYWRRLKSGKIILVRSHVRSGPTTAASTSSSNVNSFGLPGLMFGIVIVIGLLYGGVSAVAKSPPIADGASTTSPPITAATARLPAGPEGRLAEQLRNARENTGLSRREVSSRTGIAQSTINDFERALAVPSAEILEKLSSVYRLSLDEWTELEIARFEIR